MASTKEKRRKMSRTPRPCSACPLRSPNGWCAHLAITRPPNAPSCEWGRRKMNSQYAMEYNRKKFGWKKREAKAEQVQEQEEDVQ